jgi:hypothetical protein
MTDQDKSEPGDASQLTRAKAKRVRYKRLTSNLTVFGYGVALYADLQIVIPGHRPALWVTICEILAAVALFGLALLLVPRGEEP